MNTELPIKLNLLIEKEKDLAIINDKIKNLEDEKYKVQTQMSKLEVDISDLLEPEQAFFTNSDGKTYFIKKNRGYLHVEETPKINYVN